MAEPDFLFPASWVGRTRQGLKVQLDTVVGFLLLLAQIRPETDLEVNPECAEQQSRQMK